MDKKILFLIITIIAVSFMFTGCVTGQAKGGVKGSGKEKAECNDGIDNDGDGDIDFEGLTEGKGKNRVQVAEADFGCLSEEDTDESNCGDNTCEAEAGEDCSTCELDCGICPFCTDSDNGTNYNIKGTCVDSFGALGVDECMGNSLSEKYCTQDLDCFSDDYVCPYGCMDGACVEIPEDFCKDNDGGKNYSVKGTVHTTWVKTTTDYYPEENYWTDYCDGSGILHEYSCSGKAYWNKSTAVYQEFIDCSSLGGSCVDGACVETPIINETLRVCDGPRMDGTDIYTKETIFGMGGQNMDPINYVDRCIDSTELKEYYCSFNEWVTEKYSDCENGCSDGACVENTTPTECPTVTLYNSTYQLEPCEINMQMDDGAGDVDFTFHIVQKGLTQSYSFGVYGYGVGFPTYGITGGASSGAHTGNLTITKTFRDDYLNYNATNPTYSGYLPIRINYDASKELRLNINLEMLP